VEQLLCPVSIVASHPDFCKPSSFHLLDEPFQLVLGVEIAANGPWMMQQSQKRISLGFPALPSSGPFGRG